MIDGWILLVILCHIGIEIMIRRVDPDSHQWGYLFASRAVVFFIYMYEFHLWVASLLAFHSAQQQ